jgi:hypothetical protein
MIIATYKPIFVLKYYLDLTVVLYRPVSIYRDQFNLMKKTSLDLERRDMCISRRENNRMDSKREGLTRNRTGVARSEYVSERRDNNQNRK